LGLSVNYGIVRGLGGAIPVESRSGASTESQVYLPVVEKENGTDHFEAVDAETEI
jgi:hypothetical protein